MRISLRTVCGLTALAVAGSGTFAVGDVTVNGVNILNEFGEFPGPWAMAGATDQSGLDSNYTSGVTNYDGFTGSVLSSTPADQNNTWFGESGAPLPGNIDFDLGAEWNVTKVGMWSFISADTNVLDGFEVYVDDNPAFSSPDFGGSFVFVNGTGTGAAQSFDITDSVGRYVRLRLTTQNTSLVGMGEFVFGAMPVSGDCLTMTVDPLVAGQSATWNVSGATAGEQVAIVYGFSPGSTSVNGFAGYCATFGIQGVNQNKVICTKSADGGGNVSCTKKIPAGVKGRRVLSQAAERNTCPDECMSILDDQVVG